MKRISGIIAIMMTFLFMGNAIAADGTVHTLWGIDFDWSAEEIQQYLKQEKKIDMKMKTGENTYSMSLSNGGYIKINGYDAKLEYGENDTVNGDDCPFKKFIISYNFQDESPQDASAYVSAIYQGIISKYGSPGFACLRLYSHGSSAWANAKYWRKNDPIENTMHYESVFLQESKVSPDVVSILNNWEYQTEKSSVAEHIYIDNIYIFIGFDNEQSHMTMQIVFLDKMQDTSFYEEASETIEATVYQDTGF